MNLSVQLPYAFVHTSCTLYNCCYTHVSAMKEGLHEDAVFNGNRALGSSAHLMWAIIPFTRSYLMAQSLSERLLPLRTGRPRKIHVRSIYVQPRRKRFVSFSAYVENGMSRPRRHSTRAQIVDILHYYDYLSLIFHTYYCVCSVPSKDLIVMLLPPTATRHTK